MKSIFFVISFILIYSCCKEKNDTHIYTYNQYSHFCKGKSLKDFKSISYRTVDYQSKSDSTFVVKIKHDSAYYVSNGITETKDYFFQLNIEIHNSDLSSSRAYFDSCSLGLIYNLKYIKNQKIEDEKYTIYRFSTDPQGTMYPETIFFCKEFGIIGRYAYERGSMELLAGIEGVENKDYLRISEKIIDDTIFLFSQY